MDMDSAKKLGMSMVVQYKRGSLSTQALRDLKAAGYICISVKNHDDVHFKMVSGFGFEDITGDLQLMVMKSALSCYGFDDAIGKHVANSLRRSAGLKEKP